MRSQLLMQMVDVVAQRPRTDFQTPRDLLGSDAPAKQFEDALLLRGQRWETRNSGAQTTLEPVHEFANVGCEALGSFSVVDVPHKVDDQTSIGVSIRGDQEGNVAPERRPPGRVCLDVEIRAFST